MRPHLWFVAGAILAALGVVNGAFSYHGLRERLVPIYEQKFQNEPIEEDFATLLDKRCDGYDTGVRYHLYNAMGMMLLGMAASRRRSAVWDAAGFGFFTGIVLFSGMLYLLAFTNLTMLGRIIPIGGLLSVIGWLVLGIAACRGFDPKPPND